VRQDAYSHGVFNVFRHSFPSDDGKLSLRDFTDGDGWLCPHDLPTDPLTGVPYRTEIENVIRAEGFFPLPVGPQSGGFPNGHCRLVDVEFPKN
jgi:hypothetical protein